MKKRIQQVVHGTVCFLALVWSFTACAGQNILYYYSDPGDYIGQGAEVTFTGTDGSFMVYPIWGNGIRLWFTTPSWSHWWGMMIAPPTGAVFQPGAYENANRFAAPGIPGLDFSGDGRGCNMTTGRFDILELVYDSLGNISRFAANWEQHCEGGTPALWGQLRFNSDVPLSGKPIHITLQNPLNSQRCVEATDPNGAFITLSALDIKDATGGNALSFDWSSSTGQQASGSLFGFVVPLTPPTAPPISVSLTVTDLTNNSQKTVSKAICVSDTTPPTVIINHPLPGETVRGDNLILDVSVTDAVDKTINQYDVHMGKEFVSPIDPAKGRSRQQILEEPKVNGTITTTITIRAHDASANQSQQSVTFYEIPTQ